MMKRGGVLVVIAALFVLVSAAMADEFKLRSSEQNPAATAVAHVNTDRNGNLEVNLVVEHIAPPDRLNPPHSNYVVWLQAPNKQPEMLGLMRVNTDDMAASLKTKTPYHSFDLFVTAEDNNHPDSPTGPEVLRGSVQK
jgi:hypothetical protein